MRRRDLMVMAAMSASLAGTAQTVRAVEPGAIVIDGVAKPDTVRIAERWSIVGVIAEGDGSGGEQRGVAVLRNNQSKSTYTLQLGDTLPSDYAFTLKAVKNRRVIVTDGKSEVILSFAEASSSQDESDVASMTARFIDNYYRGLGDSGVEDEGTAFAAPVESGLGLPLRRFGPLREDAARSRFELYRTDRAYRAQREGAEDAEAADEIPEGEIPADSGFVVNYDNFEDVPADEVGREAAGGSYNEWTSDWPNE